MTSYESWRTSKETSKPERLKILIRYRKTSLNMFLATDNTLVCGWKSEHAKCSTVVTRKHFKISSNSKVEESEIIKKINKYFLATSSS